MTRRIDEGRRVDVTPSWTEILPALLLLLERGTPDSQRHARAELRRMAALADEARQGRAGSDQSLIDP